MKSRSFNLLVILALFLSLLGSAVTFIPAHAASFVVNNNADTNDGTCDAADCTLREAINAANANGAGVDTITFAADYTITLTSGSELPLVTTQINITGNGATKTIIQSNVASNVATYRVFHVGGTGDLTLDQLTVQNGKAINFGGGILIDSGGKLTVTNSAVSKNVASDGGGIYNNRGTLTVENSTISNNNAIAGGGIVNSSNSTLTVNNTTVSNNQATSGPGGGIYNIGTMNITGGTISGNSSSNNTGGGIFTSNNATITDSTISGNSSKFQGGGIDASSTTTITNTVISGNTAIVQGGGIFAHGGTATITNSTISGNSAPAGAGIFNSTTLNVTGSTISGNNASQEGGGIYNAAASVSTISSSTFSSNTSINGGAIANEVASAQVGTTTISNSTFTNNTVTQNGGAIYSHASNTATTTTTISNSTIAYNNASGRGGGVSAETNNAGTEAATIAFKNSLVYGNTAIVLNPNCNVINTGASLVGNSNNLFPASGDFCPTGASDITTSAALNTVVSLLANNGGPTQTMALPVGSPAIDKGDAGTCTAAPVSGVDQRGVNRPQGAVCDIGAFEAGPVIPVVTASNPSANAVLTSLSSITVVFNQDMLNDGSAKAANNTVNYILVERGANGSFNTTSCNGGVVSDDVQQTISTASYNSAGFVTSLTLASPLTAGTYRLFVCGTTSVWSAAGLELNNGVNDTTVDFTIGAAAGTGRSGNRASTTASSLPTTGFAPNKATSLPAQPATLEYANMGDLWLEIPSLNVKSTIVGVPQNADKTWDVTWLGNDTGWLNGTAFPTWNGNSVLTAHVTNASGLEGPFAALKSLRYGDQIIVHMGGVQYIYEVRNTKLARPYSTSYAFESKQDASYITLVTCSGYNPLNESYLFRRVVRAVLVSTVSE